MDESMTDLDPDVKFVHDKVEEFDKWASSVRKEMKASYELEAGRPWQKDDLAIMKEQKRPPVSFNEFLRFVDAVCGIEINNKMNHKYIPSDIPDAGAVEGVNKVIAQRTDELSDGETSHAFRDCVVCGMGWTGTRMDYEETFEGLICDDRLDPLTMGWDYRATKPDLSDGKYRFQYKTLTKENIIDRWGKDTLDKIRNATEQSNFTDADYTTGRTFERKYHFDDSEPEDTSEKFPVIWFQWSETVTKTVVVNPDTGAEEEMDNDQFARLKKQFKKFGAMPPPSAKRKRKVFYEIYVCGSVVIEEKKEIPFWKMLPMTGKYDRNRKCYFGLARIATDPQNWGDKFFSNIMHIISTAGKGPLVEKDAVSSMDQSKFEEDWAKPHKVKWLEPGAISQKKISVPDQVSLPPALGDMMQFAYTAVQTTLGLSLEFLGTAGRTQAGIVEDSRRSASMAVLAAFFDARRSHIKRSGRLKLAFAAKYIPDSVYMEVSGPEIQRYLPQIRATNFLKAKVKVDEATSSPDQKAATFSVILQLMPLLQGYHIPPEVLLTFLRYSPLPTSLLDAVQKIISAPPDPAIEKEKQLDLAEQEATVEKDKSAAMLNIAKARNEGQPDMTNIMTILQKMQETRQGMQADEQRFNMDMARQGMDMVKDTTKFRTDMALIEAKRKAASQQKGA